MIIMVCGSIGQGKSSLLGRAADYLLAQKRDVRGLISERLLRDETTSGYNLRFLPGNRRLPLSERSHGAQKTGAKAFGGWLFYEQAMAQGLKAIEQGLDARYLVIDEVGRWELDGGGWAAALPPVFAKEELTVLLGVRRDFAPEIITKFALISPEVIDLAAGSEAALASLLDLLQQA